MAYRLIALDIDGTIRSNENPLSKQTSLTIEAARNTGAIVTIVTGRMYLSALHVTADLNLISPVATYQGAHIANPVSHDILWHQPLTSQMLSDTLDVLDSGEHEILAHHRGHVYVEQFSEWIEAYVERNHVRVHVVDDLRSLGEEGVTRLIVGGDDDAVGEVTATLKRTCNARLQITRSLPYFCEVLHPETGKDIALQRLCEMLGVRQEDTVAFGNGDEDAAMIAWAGLGVAIGDGSAAAIAAADEVAPPLAEDGVAHVVERLLRASSLGEIR